jgi:hypothetical protein
MRCARSGLRHLFPYLSEQSGCNKRLRGARELIGHRARVLAAGTGL